MFLLTVFITTMTILLLLLAVVLYNINPPQAIEVTKKRTPGKAQVALSGDTDGDGVLSEEEIRVQLEGVAAQLKLPLSVVQGYWRSFNRYDVDDSGSVDAKELNNMLVDSIGHKLSEDEIKNILLDVDADGSGAIEFGEFCVLASRIDMGEQTPEEVRAPPPHTLPYTYPTPPPTPAPSPTPSTAPSAPPICPQWGTNGGTRAAPHSLHAVPPRTFAARRLHAGPPNYLQTAVS